MRESSRTGRNMAEAATSGPTRMSMKGSSGLTREMDWVFISGRKEECIEGSGRLIE